jgi:inorganic pyrophosphatase
MSHAMLQSLPAQERKTGLVHVIVHTAKSSRNKVKFDEEMGRFWLSHEEQADKGRSR